VKHNHTFKDTKEFNNHYILMIKKWSNFSSLFVVNKLHAFL
jgi:hypothetical protein